MTKVKLLLLGIGNLLFGDEGIGVHFIKYIEQKYSFEGENSLDIIDGGTLAQSLIPIMVQYDQVIIVDTINAPTVNAGELYFFDFDAIPDAINWQGSAHEVEMLQTLHLMNLAGDRPQTMIMGVVPKKIEITEFSLSQRVLDTVPLMEKTLLEYLKNLGIHTVQKKNVQIKDILEHSFKSENAYL